MNIRCGKLPLKARKTLEILTITDSAPYANRDGFPERAFRVNMRYFFPGWSGNLRSIAARVTVILISQVVWFAKDKTSATATDTLGVKDQLLKAVAEQFYGPLHLCER